MRKYFELNENESTLKFIILTAQIRKEERVQFNDLNFYLRKLEKKPSKIKPNQAK